MEGKKNMSMFYLAVKACPGPCVTLTVCMACLRVLLHHALCRCPLVIEEKKARPKTVKRVALCLFVGVRVEENSMGQFQA